MARINVGIDPLYLADQHLIAESVEITMVLGSLRINSYKIKGFTPQQYCLGKGHINFFKNKLIYLGLRLFEINKEMIRRGFKPGTDPRRFIDPQLPKEFLKDWEPTEEDSIIVRRRIVEKMRMKSDGFWRYQHIKIADRRKFEKELLTSPLYFV